MEVTAALVAASPRVTPAVGEIGIWWVGADGFDQIGGEAQLARELLEIARRWSPRARVAIADSCVAARAATWSSVRGPRGRDPVIVPPSGDEHYLAGAPLALVPMDAELRDALASLGIRTAGSLAELEAEDVERRWGSEGLGAWRLARGDDRRRPALTRVENPRSVETALPSSATTVEPLLFLVRAALDRLSEDLTSDGRSAATVAITLVLDDVRSALPRGAIAHTVTREVRLPRPTARATHLFEHCRSLLERWPLDASVSAVRVAIAATAPSSGEQGDLLSASWRDAAAMDAALARLRAELGSGSVVRPVERDEHRPDQTGEWVSDEMTTVREKSARARRTSRQRAAEAKAGSRSSAIPTKAGTIIPAHAGIHVGPSDMDPRLRGGDRAAVIPTRAEIHATSHPGASGDPLPTPPPQRVLRLVEDPEPVEVELALRHGSEAPCAVWWRGRRVAIASCSEPERLSGKWWDDDGAYRREYWLCDSEGGELLLFVDRAGGGSWYLQGWYD
jgi:protein ImuB